MSFEDTPLPEGTLDKCPQFIEFNARSRKDLSRRYSKHTAYRSNCIQICANETLREMNKMRILSSIVAPIFEEQGRILLSSISFMKERIKQTATVQPSKCKNKILTYSEFSKKANNKQDQNSWKISGSYLFVPYIYSFIEFINNKYIPLIHNINNNEKTQILHLIGIIFAVKLLNETVKFERAKEKPLIRDRTLVNSSSLHAAFKQLHPLLNVAKFYIIEKEKRRKIKKQIKSHEFHVNIAKYAQFIMVKQRNLVQNINDNKDIRNGFPLDWIQDADNDNESDTNTECSTSTNESISECHRTFQRSNTYFNRHHRNGIYKGSGALRIDKERIMNRKIKRETHICEMKRVYNSPIFMRIKKPNNPFNFDFDLGPMPLQRVGSDLHQNEMGYSFL